MAIKGNDNKTTAPTGTRPTPFTSLTCVSTRSFQAASLRDRNLKEKLYAFRISPNPVTITSYEPNSIHTRTIHLTNLTKQVQRIAIQHPKSKLFRIVSEDEGWMTVAPGLDATVDIEFVAPGVERVAKGHVGEDPSLRRYADRVRVVMENGEEMEVGLEAYPAGPIIEIGNNIDFGTVVATGKMDGVEGNAGKWLTRYVEIRNVGKRTAMVHCTWDSDLPIRVSPSTMTLCGSPDLGYMPSGRASVASNVDPVKSSAMVKIDFLPQIAGDFREVISVNLEHDIPRPEAFPPLGIALTANVIEHKLRLCSVEGTAVIDPANVDFGAIYYSQTATIAAKLENLGPTPIRWVITHAGESKPMVPSRKQLESNPDEESTEELEAELRASMSVSPSEGTLAPYESMPIKLTFSPQSPITKRGFKTTQRPPPPKSYVVPMELKIVDHAAKGRTNEGEEAVALQLTGRASAVNAVLGTRSLEFLPTQKGQCQATEITLINEGELNFGYRFERVAQFHANPRKGALGPGEKVAVMVDFKPNNLGEFKTKMDCIIEALKPVQTASDDEEDGQSKSIPVQLEGAKEVTRIPIKLQGICVAKVREHFDFDRFRKEQMSADTAHSDVAHDYRTDVAEWATATARGSISLYSNGAAMTSYPESNHNSNPEWEHKVAHRKQYVDYLRNSRTERIRNVRVQRIGNDGVEVDLHKFHLGEDYSGIDRENGLVPPEPVDGLGVIFNHGDNVEATEITVKPSTDTVDPRILKNLFEQLAAPIVHKPISTTTVPPASNIDKPLTGADLANIFTAHSLIDFGQITTHSLNITPLNFLNAGPSRQPIHISILETTGKAPINDDSLEGILVQPSHQIVEPMSIAGFQVRFCSHKPGMFERKITYLVNGRYKYSIPVRVNVVPVSLELSTKNVEVEVQPGLNGGNGMVVIAETEVMLINKGNYGAGFKWCSIDADQSGKEGDEISLEGRFTVQPSTGVVGPNSAVRILVRFAPGIKSTHEQSLQLQVFDEGKSVKELTQTLNLRCKGVIPPSNCVLGTSLKQGPLDLGILCTAYPSGSVSHLRRWNALYTAIFSLSQQHRPKTESHRGAIQIRIKNTSANRAVFTAKKTLPTSEVEIYPTSGIISATSSLDLGIECLPTRAAVMEDTVLITPIGAGKVLKVPIKYDARVPQVEVDAQGGDLAKGTIIGSYGFKRVAIQNRGTVAAGVIVDLRDHPDFEVKLRDNVPANRKATASSARARSTSGRRIRNAETSATVRYAHLIKALGPDHPMYAFDVEEKHLSDERKTMKDRQGKIFMMEIPPGETLLADICFKPTKPDKHVFHLPIYFLGSENTPIVDIEAEGIPSPLQISKAAIQFKNKVVHREAGTTSVSHLKAAIKEPLTLSNTSKKSMEWWFDLEPLEGDQVFRVEPWRGVIAPGETQTLTVSFQPENTGLFEATLPLHLESLGPKPLLFIPLQGTGVEPSLAFSPPELFLPVVPISHETRAIFSIVNYGCERTEIRDIIPEEMAGSLELMFPEGKLLKSDGEKLTVVVRFIARPQGPASFTTKIGFSNDGRKGFYLPVHGTSDTSLLTLQPYLWLKTVEKAPVETLTENQKRNRILNGPRPFRTPAGISLENGPNLQAVHQFYDQLGETLVRWLEDHLGLQAAWRSFPQQLLATNGRALLDLIQSISGRKFASVASASPIAPHEDRTHVLYKQYSDVLVQLTSLGALLSSVKPEFLLSLDEYRVIVQRRATAMKKDASNSIHDEQHEYNRKIENHFSIISKEAWCMLLLQVVRVHVAHAVTPRQFRALPAVGKDESAMDWQTLSQPDVYGTCENVLLKWVAYHVWKWTRVSQRLTNFTSDFDDWLPIAYLLMAHLPSMNETHFSELIHNCSKEEEYNHNFSIVATALVDLFPGSTGIETSFKRMQQNAGLGMDAFLLLLFLYQTLPNFIPKAVIDFQGKLHERIHREIEITNPTTRAITYAPELQGSTDFFLPRETATSIYVPPKGSVRLPIEFVSKFVRSEQGSLVLRSRKMGLNSASVLVFELRSFVEDAAPKRVMRVDGVMYAIPPSVVEVEVVNPFEVKGKFKIVLKQDTSEGNPPPFRSKVEELVLDGHQSALLQVTFLPFELAHHECILHFADNNVGEFTYQIMGRGLAPPPSETLLWTGKAGDALDKAIRVVPGNQARDKAIQFLLGGVKARGGMKAKKGSEMAEAESWALPKKPLKYKVDYSSPIFRGPSEITIKPPLDKTRERRQIPSLDQNYTELPVVFNPRTPGKYSCRITLTCLDASDIRIFIINGISISEGSRAALDFTIPARQSVTQDIPIVNKTDEDWMIKAQIQGSKHFTGPYSLTVRAQTTGIYPITFSPPKSGEIQSLLTLSNLQTAQKYIYHLRGLALDPLPEGKKEIESRARDKIVERFRVYNHTDQDVEYDVVTDVPYSSGDARIGVPAGKSKEYELMIHARGSGSFVEPTIRFINRADGSFIWYIVTLRVNPPPAEDTIRLSTTVRQPVNVEIPLTNPLDHPIVYKVHITGEGLTGEQQVVVPPREEKAYTLAFIPMLKMRTSGTVKFHNNEVGEFWYQLKLDAKEAPPISIPEMSCELGKCSSYNVPLTNPLLTPTTLHLTITNPRNFQLIHPPMDLSSQPSRSTIEGRSTMQVTIGPQESTEVQLVFWPSSLTESSVTSVEVRSQQIGDSVFKVEGRGTLPTPFPLLHLPTPLHTPTSSSITFTNPLIDPIAISITLEQDQNGDTLDFSLLHHRQKKIVVAGMDSIDIPFVYKPEKMVGREANVIVQMEGGATGLKWVFPVVGIPEQTVPTPPILLETRTREPITREIESLLPGFIHTADQNECPTFSYEWVPASRNPLATAEDQALEQHAIKSLQLKLLESRFEEEGVRVKFKATYNPPTPFTTPLHLLLTTSPNRTTYRLPLRLISHPPSLDDIITIEGSITSLSCVSFVIQSHVEYDRKFRAYFLSEKGQFVVSPREGVLVPERRRRDAADWRDGDNVFVVGYRAREYGKTVVGVLVVECEDISWTFEVRGVTPASTPSRRTSRIGSAYSTSSSRQHTRHIPRRNFIRENSMNPIVVRATAATSVEWAGKGVPV